MLVIHLFPEMEMNYAQLKQEIESKINIEEHLFYWYGEEDSERDSGEDEIVLATTETLGHGLNLCFSYVLSRKLFQIEFMVGFGMEAEITTEFFEYVRQTYIDPIIESSYNLSYMSTEFNEKRDDRANYWHKIHHSENLKRTTYFYSKGDYDDFMTKQENVMVFNSFLAHPPVSLASTNYWIDSDTSEFYTSFSASSFSIMRLRGKGRGRNRSHFFFKLNYFPDPKASVAIRHLKETVLKDTPFTVLPDDMPMDLLGAISSSYVEELTPLEEWKTRTT